MSQTFEQAMGSPPTETSPGNNVGKYRRNGKLQSCEPCRKSKLRCDHTIPTCGRCVKRRCAEQCVYHPNPLTQQSRPTPRQQSRASKRSLPTPSLSTEEKTPSSSSSSADAVSLGHKASPQDLLTDQQSVESQLHRTASAPPLRVEPEDVVERRAAFLGDTSFRSIFKESFGILGIVCADLESSKIKSPPVEGHRIAQGCLALSFLKNRRLVNSLISYWFEIGEGFGVSAIEPIVKGWLRKLWLSHGDVLEEQDPEKIEQLCKLLWRNTQSPLKVDGNTTPAEWIDRGTGPNIRWGVLGVIAAVMGNCSIYMDAANPIFKEHNSSRLPLSNELSLQARRCLSFCRECEALDDVFVHLLIESMCLTSALKGDSSHDAYRATGEILDAIVALGWHQEIKTSSRVPYFLAELRRRARANAYFAETSVASFLGRPPRASHRYWNLESPQDLSDEEIMLDPRDIKAILAEKRDANGFNTVNQLRRSTWIRGWLEFAFRREDILDLALGHYSAAEVRERAEVISRKIEEHWKELPEFMQRARHERVVSTSQPPLRILCMTILRQGTRANDLLLQRVLIRKAGASSDRLIQMAQVIFKEVLEFCQRQEFMNTYQMDITAILVVHGLRSSAIIAVELLKQELLPSYPPSPLLSRSQTIQDLSVFAARLDVVDPTDGLYTMCQQGRKVITRILDRILAPPPAPVEQQAQNCQVTPSSHQHQQGIDQMNLDVPMSTMEQGVVYAAPMGGMMPADFNFSIPDPSLPADGDLMFMQWLESVDWERQGVWVGL